MIRKKAVVADVTEAVSKNLGAPKENIHVILEEMKKSGLWRSWRSKIGYLSTKRLSTKSVVSRATSLARYDTAFFSTSSLIFFQRMRMYQAYDFLRNGSIDTSTFYKIKRIIKFNIHTPFTSNSLHYRGFRR